MDYDVLILGGGLVGCSIAYELSKYNLNIALIEKDYDIADDISIINTEIVYAGLEIKDNEATLLQHKGNQLMDELANKFNVPFKRCGSIILAEDKETEDKLKSIYENNKDKEGYNVKLINRDDISKLEPELKGLYSSALYCEDIGVISPCELALGYGEVAFQNNVNFKLEEEVIDIENIAKGFRVVTNKNRFTCKIVINTTPGENYSMDFSQPCCDNTEKEYANIISLNKYYNNGYKRVIFSLNKDGDKTISCPTNKDETIGLICSNDNFKNHLVIEKVSKLIPDIKANYINSFFTSEFCKNDIIIDDSQIKDGYVKIRGKHPAIVTMTPAIAEKVRDNILGILKCKPKKEFLDKRREYYRFNEMSNEERNEIIRLNNRYGKIVCSCERITEGEIVDAIRRPLGARTIEGIKRRTGVCFGRCQGSQCFNEVVSILARETNKSINDIVKDSKNSKIILNRIKEFDEM